MTITPEMKAIWESVKANSVALNNCVGPHDFKGVGEFTQYKDGKLYKRYVCTKCGGSVSSHDWHWYERGLKHGRGESNG